MLHNVTQCYITFSYTNKRGNAHYQLNNFVCLNEQNLRSLFYFHRFLKWKFIPAPCGDKLFFINRSFHHQKPNFTAQLFTCHWSPSSYLLMCLLDPMSNPTHLVSAASTFLSTRAPPWDCIRMSTVSLFYNFLSQGCPLYLLLVNSYQTSGAAASYSFLLTLLQFTSSSTTQHFSCLNLKFHPPTPSFSFLIHNLIFSCCYDAICSLIIRVDLASWYYFIIWG